MRLDINSKDQCHFMTWEHVGGIQGDYCVIMETNKSDPEAKQEHKTCWLIPEVRKEACDRSPPSFRMSHPRLLSSLCTSCLYHYERICFCTTKPLGSSSFVLAALETSQLSARYASKLDHEFCFLWLKVSFHFQKNPQKKLLLFFSV